MPAINFQSQFVPLIEQGKKRQTIRKLRKKGNVKVGDTLYLYTNQRTSNCRKIGQYVCESVHQISIFKDANAFYCVLINGRDIVGKDFQELYAADGFKTPQEFIEFFDYQYGLPFDGVLIKW